MPRNFAVFFLGLAAVLPAADSLSQAAAKRGIYFGAAVQSGYINQDATYAATLAREYSMIEPEYEMLWSAIHPSQNTYAFSGADALVNYAQAHGIPLRADHLAWHNSLPAWLTNGNFTAAQLNQILHDHIMAVAGRYAGKVYSWEVVNEAVSDSNPPALRDSIWNNQPGIGLTGIAWIEQAFQWAHQADPNARLFYNDYSAEDTNTKSDFIYNMLKQMLADGTPIHGVGLQMHLTNNINYPSAPGLANNIKRLTDLGLEVIITEMDVRLPVDSSGNAGASDLAIQAQLYGRAVSACIQFARCTAIQTWGITDLHSWIPTTFPGFGAGLPFDKNYQAKSAYTSTLNALQAPATINAANLLNAASFTGGAVAPGEIVTLFDARYGPPALVTLQLDAAGKITNSLAGVQLLFDGTPAPVIYARTGQSSFIVPYAIAGKSSTTVQYVYQGAYSNSVTVPVVAAAPGLFSIDSTGSGPGAILDLNYRLNSASNAAKAGDIVSLFATGAGVITPAGPDGGLVGTDLPHPVAPVSVQIGGVVTDVISATGAPGLTNALLQINVYIPAGLLPGPQPVVLKVGDAASPATVTIAIR
ncbi:MAG TPA: endo-1,4-beta-xylanase [Verrucomicrobiae bacterium]|nr:endo-1,4-beta-xylanase [Verrucomicrobiae bacterium]